jgi:hypothetical protein
MFRRECLGDDDGEYLAAAELEGGGDDVAAKDTFEGESVAENVLGEDGTTEALPAFDVGVPVSSENFNRESCGEAQRALR